MRQWKRSGRCGWAGQRRSKGPLAGGASRGRSEWLVGTEARRRGWVCRESSGHWKEALSERAEVIHEWQKVWPQVATRGLRSLSVK